MNLQKHDQFPGAGQPEAATPSETKEAKAASDAEPGKLSRKAYEKELRKLQVKLCDLQDWVRETGARVVVVFEGRDTAGKGGLIRRLTERVSPRTFKVVALSAQAEGEPKKLFLQRYIEQFPAAGEIVIFDRSWYNRAGVDRVMGFASKAQVQSFLDNVARFEQWVTKAGIILVKFWLEVGQKEQERRFRARIEDPLRQWKLSPMDLKSYSKWYDYSRARDAMLEASDHKAAPWHIVLSDDKKRARLNAIAHLLKVIPYERVKRDKPELPKRSRKNRYNDRLDFEKLKIVPQIY